MSHFDWLFLGPDFLFPVFSAGEAVYWLHWLYDSISLLNGLFYHMSHRVGKQFLAFFSSVTVSVVVVRIVDVAVWVRGIGITVFVSRKYFDYFQFALAVFSTIGTDFYNVLVFYSNGTLVWFYQLLQLQYCGLQYLFVAHPVFPNHFAPILFQVCHNLLICAILQMGLIY